MFHVLSNKKFANLDGFCETTKENEEIIKIKINKEDEWSLMMDYTQELKRQKRKKFFFPLVIFRKGMMAVQFD